MNIVLFLLPISILLALIFVVGFIYSVKSGQYDDLDTPPHRMILDDDQSSSPQAD